MTSNPQVFNELLLQTSGSPKLKINQFICDPATKQDVKQRFKKNIIRKKIILFFLLELKD